MARAPRSALFEPFLLIARPPRIFTAALFDEMTSSSDEYRGLNRVFQHIARFINVTTTSYLHSYGRRLLGLRFDASLTLTCPLNLPAPGRHQTLYVVLRLRRVL